VSTPETFFMDEVLKKFTTIDDAAAKAGGVVHFISWCRAYGFQFTGWSVTFRVARHI
jgi:hypothetical protein